MEAPAEDSRAGIVGSGDEVDLGLGEHSGLLFPSPGDLPHPGIDPRSPTL